MTFSLIIPSRNRTNLLYNCLNSFWNQSSTLHRDKIEFVLAVDADDYETLTFIESVRQQYRMKILISSFRHNRTKYLINNACKIAAGDYLWILNDDVEVTTFIWDIILKYSIADFLVDKPDTKCYISVDDGTHYYRGISACCFPLISRATFEALGQEAMPELVDGAGADTELYRIFKSGLPDRICNVRHVKLKHYSPHNFNREVDSTWIRSQDFTFKSHLQLDELENYVNKLCLY